MEALRVLYKIAYLCREASSIADGGRGWRPVSTSADRPLEPGDRITALEAPVATAQEAITCLAARVRILEGVS